MQIGCHVSASISDLWFGPHYTAGQLMSRTAQGVTNRSAEGLTLPHLRHAALGCSYRAQSAFSFASSLSSVVFSFVFISVSVVFSCSECFRYLFPCSFPLVLRCKA